MSSEAIDLKSITPALGEEVVGLDIAQTSDAQAAALRAALIDRKVLVFRDQTASPAQFANFMRIFGIPVREDLVVSDGNPPEVGAIHIKPDERQTINFWHLDHSFRECPTPVLALYANMLPPCGGDTLFASLEAAYQALPEDTKKRIAGLHTLHKVTVTQNTRRRHTEEQIAAYDRAPSIRHPLVARNPDNGRPYLFVNVPIYCRSIEELQDDEGKALLAELYAHAGRPEFHFRLVWRPGTIVVWDNARCLHYPVSDYYPHERRLWRVVIEATERPQAA
jgi:taurine dioxygenase